MMIQFSSGTLIECNQIQVVIEFDHRKCNFLLSPPPLLVVKSAKSGLQS